MKKKEEVTITFYAAECGGAVAETAGKKETSGCCPMR